MIQVLLVTICLAVFPYQGSSIILESGDVNDYEVVYPQKVTALPKGAVQQKYEDAMQYEFKVNGEPVVLHLEKNKGLFSKDYSETHYSPDDREITTYPPVEDHCYYHGHIQNDADSTASISACNGLKGHFRLQGETYFIEPLKLSDSEAHAIYKYENVEKEDEAPKMCGVTQTNWESDEPIKKASQIMVTAQQQRSTKRYIELIIVADHRMVTKHNDSLKPWVFQMVNTMNELYQPLDLRVALTGLEIWLNRDLINVTSAANVTLALFEDWREAVLLKRKNHDNAQLLTAIELNGATIGLASIGSMCDPTDSTGIVEDHSRRNLFVAITMAHELGHNLGMDHDKDYCSCGANSCVMSATLIRGRSYQFSNCSKEDCQRYLRNSNPECILNEPWSTDIVSPPLCGNELVEGQEECDCGTPENCQNECCDAASCKLKSGSQCGHGECCEQCQFSTSGTECRAAKSECDLPEHCTGQSIHCPTDDFHRNGQPCLNNLGYCYNGKCPIMKNQCIAFLGPNADVSEDSCFEENLMGHNYAYCRKKYGRKVPCAPQDVKCGRLYCSLNVNGYNITCIPFYKPMDDIKGMVDHGTKCADEKVCSNRQCVDVTTAY